MYDIDDFIKHKVQGHVSDVPPHIWDNIQRKRSYPYTLLNFFRVRWRSASFVIALLGLLWMLVYQQQSNTQLAIHTNDKAMDVSNLIDSHKQAFDSNDLKQMPIENSGYSPTAMNYDQNNKESISFVPFKNEYQWSNSSTNMVHNLTTTNTRISSFNAAKNTFADTNKNNTSHIVNNKLQNNSKQNSITTNRTQHKNNNSLMNLDNEWVQSAYSTDGNKKVSYPYGPPIKYYQAIPDYDYSRLSVEDLPQILEAIPLKENILHIKDANEDGGEIGEEIITENLMNERIAGEELLKEKEIKKEMPRKPKKKKKKWLWLDLVAAPNYVVKNLTSYESTQESNEYVNARLRSEQAKFGYTLGMRASFRLHDVSEIRTGILYSKITEKFEYQRPPEIDPITGKETTFALETNKNKYEFIDIPILIGYREDRKVFDFNVNFGILLNLAFTQQGRILDPESLASIDLRGTNDAPIFKSRSGLSLYSSIGYNYKFSDKVHLLIEPSLKYVVRPINHWEYPVRQRFHTFGLTTGLRVNIGR